MTPVIRLFIPSRPTSLAARLSKKQKAAYLPRGRPLIRLRHLLPSAEGRRLSVCAHRELGSSLVELVHREGVESRAFSPRLLGGEGGHRPDEGGFAASDEFASDPANIGSFLEAGWWVGAKDPQPMHDTRSVGRGSFAPTRHPLRMTGGCERRANSFEVSSRNDSSVPQCLCGEKAVRPCSREDTSCSFGDAQSRIRGVTSQ